MADPSLAKSVNERGILTLLRRHDVLSRADLARRLSLTPATITRLVAGLMRRGLVREAGPPPGEAKAREPGRPGIGVEIDPGGAYFAGVEIGVGVLRIALIDLAARVAWSEELPLARDVTPETVVALVAARLAALDAEALVRGRILAGGVTVPGLVTLDGFVVTLPILGWSRVNLLAMLAAATSLPFTVENNANAAAFGALYADPALPSACTLFVKLGSGCGGAAIVGGRLLRGAAGTGLEVGHMRLTEDGVRCSCGQRGCLETWVNLAALARLARGRDDIPETELARLPGAVAGEAARGEPRAVAAVTSLVERLGQGLASLVNLLNPTTILIGGALRPVIAPQLAALRAEVAGRIIPGTLVPDLRMSSLDAFECAVGAASLAHHEAFDVATIEIAALPTRQTRLR